MVNFNDFVMRNIDYILVVDKYFNVIYNSRFDAKMGNVPFKMEDKVNLFEIYPDLNRTNSSIAKTMSTGEIIYNDKQEFADINGKVYVTQNVTIPIFKSGHIGGVVELTKDLTNVEHVKEKKKYFNTIATQSAFPSNRDNNAKISFDDILTVDDKMFKAIEEAKTFAMNMNPTLIYGETGTGKELFAQAMINYGAGVKQKIVVQNCAAVPDNLIESILFGTVRGAYTGAENRKGLFEEANGGIFFLDELNALPYSVQGKLLRVVQEGTFRPIGSNVEKRVNVKIIAAMNVDPQEAIEAKILRKDLFYRLSGHMIFLPPLRDRKNDIEYLTDYYIESFDNIYNKNVSDISNELRQIFLDYKWDGNVRELKHVIESMVSMSKDDILNVEQIPLYMHNKLKDVIDALDSPSRSKTVANSKGKTLEENVAFGDNIARDAQLVIELSEGENNLNSILEEVEKEYIITTLKKVGGNKTKAGKILGIPRQTLKYKMDKMGINYDNVK